MFARSLAFAIVFLAATFVLSARAGEKPCFAAPPPDAERFLPLTDQPHPWGEPTLRHDHPRLFFDAARLQRFRAHWKDPGYASVMREYDESQEPLGQALRGLATEDPVPCRLAARTVAADYKPNMSLSSGPPGGTDPNLFGAPDTIYGDAAALVFDWCYAALPPDLKARLVAKIEQQNQLREEALNKRFQWHEAFFSGFHAYLLGVLAIEGEAGASPRLQKAQNALQNWTELGNELHGDGSYKTYTHQDLFFATPSILWSMATGQDVVRRNQFLLHHADFLLRRLSPDGADFIAGPGDQASDPRGMLIRIMDPSALGPFLIADYLHDSFAQWLGELMFRKQGLGHRGDNPRWLYLIFHDDALRSVPPENAGIPPVRYLREGGMVDMRSGWNIGKPSAADIDAWFYLGPVTEHAEADAGHFTLWRGNDDLITEGSNYFTRPTKYHLLWEALSFARNTMEFSPAASTLPDLEGGQVPPPPMVYDDGRAFGDIGAERLVKNQDAATRARLALLSAEHYPIANRLIWYTNYAGYLGEITDFRNLPEMATVTGDASAAYDPRHVKSYRRTIIDVKPDVFIIRDRFEVADVDRIRMLFHERERPDAAGLKIIQGTDSAGILETDQNRLTIHRGGSAATIELLWPEHATLRLVGGPGFDQYIDGANIDPTTTIQDWLLKQPDFADRMGRLHGIWRSEFETDPAAAQGEMIAVISVGPRGAKPVSARLIKTGGSETIAIRRADGSVTNVRLPDAEPAAGTARACRPN
jgi:hypothetical protein